MQSHFLREDQEPRPREAAQEMRKVFFVDAAHFILGCFLSVIWILVGFFHRVFEPTML